VRDEEKWGWVREREREREREKESAEARIIHKCKNPAAAKGEKSHAPK
jgi:hypothetical protein